MLRLVLTRPSGPDAHGGDIPSLALRAFMGLGNIREGLPVPREPALLAKRSQDGEAPASME